MVFFFFSYESKVYYNVIVEVFDLQGGVNQEVVKENFLFNYYQVKLVFGFVLFEFGDVIKVGDGERFYDFNKVVLLLYKVYGKIKYVCYFIVFS